MRHLRYFSKFDWTKQKSRYDWFSFVYLFIIRLYNFTIISSFCFHFDNRLAHLEMLFQANLKEFANKVCVVLFFPFRSLNSILIKTRSKEGEIWHFYISGTEWAIFAILVSKESFDIGLLEWWWDQWILVPILEKEGKSRSFVQGENMSIGFSWWWKFE